LFFNFFNCVFKLFFNFSKVSIFSGIKGFFKGVLGIRIESTFGIRVINNFLKFFFNFSWS